MPGVLDWLMDRMPAQPVSWDPPLDVLPRNPDLERRIRQDPDDRQALAVYASFLSGAGDSRGAVLASWLQATGPTPDPHLTARVHEWTQAHGSALVAGAGLRGSWRVNATFRGPLLDRWGHSAPNSDLGALLDHAVGLALRSVRLFVLMHGGHEWLDTLRARTRPSPLRAVRLDWGAQEVDLSDRWDAFDGLGELSLGANGLELGHVRLPDVEALAFQVSLKDTSLSRFESANLRWLRFTLAPPDAVLSSMLSAPRIERLTLGLSTVEDIERVLACPHLRRLRELQLGYGIIAINDAAAMALCTGEASLRHLERLEVRLRDEPDPLIVTALERTFGSRLTLRSESGKYTVTTRG